MKSGAIIDASVTDSPHRPRGRKEYEASVDRREAEGGAAAAAAMLREVPKPNVDGGTARYVGLAKTHAQHVMEAIAHNLYRAPGLIVANA